MMSTYNLLIEQLAEWFMQLFFDPCYHVVSTDDSINLSRKQRVDTLLIWLKRQELVLTHNLVKLKKPFIRCIAEHIAVYYRLSNWMETHRLNHMALYARWLY